MLVLLLDAPPHTHTHLEKISLIHGISFCIYRYNWSFPDTQFIKYYEIYPVLKTALSFFQPLERYLVSRFNKNLKDGSTKYLIVTRSIALSFKRKYADGSTTFFSIVVHRGIGWITSMLWCYYIPFSARGNLQIMQNVMQSYPVGPIERNFTVTHIKYFLIMMNENSENKHNKLSNLEDINSV